nr:hypothetical protein OH826_13510 [Streptomyces sp. NBC_00899]
MVLPSSGKDPYGTPDRGGFTGWVDWSVDAGLGAGRQWLEGDVRAFAQSVTLDAPGSLRVGGTAQLSGSIVQPEGVSAGTRVVPLRYPMSVDWGGSSSLAVGSGKQAVEEARRKGKVAILDPLTRTLTALRCAAPRLGDRDGGERLDARLHRRRLARAGHGLPDHHGRLTATATATATAATATAARRRGRTEGGHLPRARPRRRPAPPMACGSRRRTGPCARWRKVATARGVDADNA